jgi:hypothetical protein
MAIKPSALEAFANPIDEEGGDVPAEEGAPEDAQEGGPGKFGMLITLLEQFAEDVLPLTEEFNPDQLIDVGQELDEAEQDQIREGVGQLDEELQAELASALPGVTLEEAQEVADHLEAEGIIDDAAALAGWLFRIGEVGLGEGGEGEDTEEEDPDADEGLEEEDPEELDFEEA